MFLSKLLPRRNLLMGCTPTSAYSVVLVWDVMVLKRKISIV